MSSRLNVRISGMLEANGVKLINKNQKFLKYNPNATEEERELLMELPKKLEAHKLHLLEPFTSEEDKNI
jgi:hypothetical protein